jgi:hypothetical protein
LTATNANPDKHRHPITGLNYLLRYKQGCQYMAASMMRRSKTTAVDDHTRAPVQVTAAGKCKGSSAPLEAGCLALLATVRHKLLKVGVHCYKPPNQALNHSTSAQGMDGAHAIKALTY